jgi:polysaccharide biosynthesis/export protein
MLSYHYWLIYLKFELFALSNNFLNVLKRSILNVAIFLTAGLFFSCGSYRQNIMFQVPEGKALKESLDAAEKNYTIQKNDYLELEVLTNKGEKIIDPEFSQVTGQTNQSVGPVKPLYLVDENGIIKFPMIGEIKLEGLTLRKGEEVLQDAYSKFYSDSYVILKYTNKRVIVLGAPGGQVIPLANENMRLVEVLALAKGVTNDAKAQNIRVLRDDQVFVADLSTFDGYVKNNIVIRPGDVVYVEPIRKPFTEGVREYGPILSIITTLTTLVVVIINQ